VSGLLSLFSGLQDLAFGASFDINDRNRLEQERKPLAHVRLELAIRMETP